MAFTVPNFTRKQVSKAGNVLIDPNSTLEQRSTAFDVLNHWRSCHAYPINTFQATLRNRLKKVCESALVAQRLKRSPSILKKLTLNPGMQMARMQDVGGLRAVVENLHQVRQLEKIYREGNFSHELIGIDDYINNPKNSGYRSLHLIYKYKNPINPIYDGLCIELQVRTKLQHAWATAVETIGTFLDQALKSSEGSKEWLDYFKLVGAAFALLENSPVSEAFSSVEPIDIYRNAHEETERLEVKRKLSAFAIAANAIESRQTQGHYHLVVLDSETRMVKIRSFGKKKLVDANLAYAEAEAAAESSRNLQVVLVATNSIDALRKAYPNYFLDTRQFTFNLQKIKRLVEGKTR
ncbi:RelA/SpoT domain-containing protein [Vogesella sp. GCM10023246]|uniref:RelA/SpoT domain-containing protein n=1 Tax=Vogesella oryzagri TaxID=3160864 RepID=A0ABV1M5C1_9NEIS